MARRPPSPAEQRERDLRRRAKPDWKTKQSARAKINNAIRDGRTQPKGCAVCGKRPAQAHHVGSYKTGGVRWLCAAHHGRLRPNGALSKAIANAN